MQFYEFSKGKKLRRSSNVQWRPLLLEFLEYSRNSPGIPGILLEFSWNSWNTPGILLEFSWNSWNTPGIPGILLEF